MKAGASGLRMPFAAAAPAAPLRPRPTNRLPNRFSKDLPLLTLLHHIPLLLRPQVAGVWALPAMPREKRWRPSRTQQSVEREKQRKRATKRRRRKRPIAAFSAATNSSRAASPAIRSSAASPPSPYLPASLTRTLRASGNG